MLIIMRCMMFLHGYAEGEGEEGIGVWRIRIRRVMPSLVCWIARLDLVRRVNSIYIHII